MPYDFKIGDAVPYIPTAEEIDTGYDRAELRMRVAEPLRAPRDGALLSMGYGEFRAWAEFVGLRDLFYSGSSHHTAGLIPHHPGCARLTPGHLARFREALAAAEKGNWERGVEVAQWFVRWTEKALAECSVPALHNR